MSISIKMKEVRLSKNLTIAECAKKLGVSASTYREWEYGRAISGEPYQNIAEILGISVSELMGYKKSNLIDELESISRSIENIQNHIKITLSKL